MSDASDPFPKKKEEIDFDVEEVFYDIDTSVKYALESETTETLNQSNSSPSSPNSSHDGHTPFISRSVFPQRQIRDRFRFLKNKRLANNEARSGSGSGSGSGGKDRIEKKVPPTNEYLDLPIHVHEPKKRPKTNESEGRNRNNCDDRDEDENDDDNIIVSLDPLEDVFQEMDNNNPEKPDPSFCLLCAVQQDSYNNSGIISKFTEFYEGEFEGKNPRVVVASIHEQYSLMRALLPIKYREKLWGKRSMYEHGRLKHQVTTDPQKIASIHVHNLHSIGVKLTENMVIQNIKTNAKKLELKTCGVYFETVKKLTPLLKNITSLKKNTSASLSSSSSD